MASATKLEVIGARLKARFSDRLRDATCIRGLSAAYVDSIVHDLRISRTELKMRVVRGGQGPDELPKALGVERLIVARKESGVLRDVTLLCAL